MREIGTIRAEGFECIIREDSDERVFFKADFDNDADGANGQNGKQAAYMVGDKGSEYLANGGMKMRDGRVVFATSWGRDIVLIGPDGQPKVFPGGIIASTTWYRDRSKAINDPASYVDSETVPYIVVPNLIIQGVAGIVRGCRGRVTYRGKSVEVGVLDKGPRNRIGEGSIACARAVGIDPSPRHGGVETPDVLFELWPGHPFHGFELQPS